MSLFTRARRLGWAAPLLGVANDRFQARLHTQTALAVLVIASTLAYRSPAVKADMYISDGDRIGRYDNNGNLINANFVPLLGATGLTIGPDGYLYAASALGYNLAPAILRYDPSTGAQIGGPFVAYQGQPPSPDPHDVIDPQGMHFGPGGNLYVADINGATQNVHVYDGSGHSVQSLNSPALYAPRAVAFDAQSPQHLYVTSSDRVLQYDFGTQSFTTFTQLNPADPIHMPLNDAKDLAFGPDHKLYVLDWSGATPDVVRFNADGSYDSLLINFLPTTFFPGRPGHRARQQDLCVRLRCLRCRRLGAAVQPRWHARRHVYWCGLADVVRLVHGHHSGAVGAAATVAARPPGASPARVTPLLTLLPRIPGTAR